MIVAMVMRKHGRRRRPEVAVHAGWSERGSSVVGIGVKIRVNVGVGVWIMVVLVGVVGRSIIFGFRAGLRPGLGKSQVWVKRRGPPRRPSRPMRGR